jgi:23S rRNA (uracil1939-C5)-methyltransferase
MRKMTQTIDLIIESLVYGGDAMSRLPDGRVVFLPDAIPTEQVRAHVVEDKPRYLRAEMLEILKPAASRVAPRCMHFGICGGCHYQYMDYAGQVRAKAGILKEQLERIGGFHNLPEVEVNPSPEPWNYRNSVQFHLTPEGKLGYQKARSNQTFAICECHLPEGVINDIWPQIEIEPIQGLERISLRVGVDNDVMLVLEGAEVQPLDFNIEGLPVSVVQQRPAGTVILAGSDHIMMHNSGRQFKVSAGSFFQVNNLQAAAMVGYLLDHLPLEAGHTVVDAYCGVGLFSVFMASKVKRLVGIEISPEACEDFTINLDEFDNVDLYEAPVENVLGSINFHPDIIVLDPPRTGLGAKTLQGLLGQDARNLAYVSCDPSTLARDARKLASGGYVLKDIAFFDMFPQTYHIESISLFEK